MKDDTIAFISGGGLSFWNLKDNDRDAVWSERNGFSKAATNHKHGIFACAEYGVNPSINVYSYPSKEVLFSFADVCSLDVLELVISRDGKRMIAVAGVPDFQIRYFDIEKGINYDLVPFKVDKDFLKVVFHPANNEAFIILAKQSITYCEIKAIYDENNAEQKIVRYQIESKQYVKPKENLPFEYMNALWDVRNKLYVTDSICRMHILQMEDFKKDFPITLKEESIVESENMIDKYHVYKREVVQDTSTNVDEKPPLVRSTVFSVGNIVHSMILTRKHLIIANDDDNIEWYILDKKSEDDKKDKDAFEPKETEEKLEKETEYHFGETTTQKIVNMHYNHQMDIIYIATDNGNLYSFPFKAEINPDEDEEYEEDRGDKAAEDGEEEEPKEIDVNIQDVGFSHSKAITFIKEIPNSSLIVSGGLDGKIILWNGYKSLYQTEYISESDLSCGDVNPAGSLLVAGTTKGTIKIFDITNREFVRLVHYKKILKKEKPITELKFSPDGELIAIGAGSKKIIFVYAKPSHNFKVLGKLKFQIPVSSFVWSKSDKMPLGKPGILAVADQGLLFAAPSPPITENYQNVDLDYEICPMYCRRIDYFLEKIAVVESSGEVYLTGKDKFLKKYKIPDELIAKTNPGFKAPPAPIEELNGHPLPVNVCFTSQQSGLLVSGAQDGSIFVREIANPSKHTHFKAHNFKSNGVCSLEMGREIPIIYSGGYEGSLFSWLTDEDMEIPSRENEMKIEDPDVQELEELEDNFDEDIMHYERVIEEEEYQAQEDEREKVKGDIKDELDQIRNKLKELLLANEYADELEKLDRGDFCIDTEAREKILREGNERREQIKNEAQREIYRNEILFTKIKEKTWDQMETHLKALVGLTSTGIVFNFHVRKRTEQELRKLQLVLDMREMERKESAHRNKEVIDVESFCKKPDSYIINGAPGYTPLILVDYEAKEEVAEIKKEGKDDRQDGRRGNAPARQVRGKPQQNQTKEEKKNDDEDKKIEETQKTEKEKQENPAWGNLYGAFELLTNNRKRNQIVIIKDLIFKIKEKFNKEFEALSVERQRLIDTINEKNNRIKEIYETLKNDGELTRPRINPLENPERVLKVEPDEVGFERYLTKDEREKLEEDEKKEAERIRLLNADDAGARAVKQMMGGTLEEKKETPLTEELQREEWMNKPYEEMDDDEKIKFSEFEAREQQLKEEREKLRKNLELELRKLKNEIKEICEKFDEKMFVLYRRRLEYDYRIYEQELYIIKLTLSMLIEDDNVKRKSEYNVEYEDLKNKESILREHLLRLDRIRNTDEKAKTDKETEYKDVLVKYDPKIKQIYNQIFEKDDKKGITRENWADDPQFQNILVKLNPFYELDKVDAKRKKNSEFSSYEDDIEKSIESYKTTNDITDDFKRRVIEAFRTKFNLKKDLDEYERDYRDLIYYMTTKEKDRRENDELSRKKKKHITYLEEQLGIAISDVEIQLRFNQGQTEIPQDEPVPRLADAILINRSLIEKKNDEIRRKGNDKTVLMTNNMSTEFEKKKLEHKMLLLAWELNDLEIKTKEVHGLKLRKEMQIALTKKDQDHNQAELMKLTKQSQLLKEATEKRIEIYRKKEEKVKREIEYLQRENQQLSTQGHALGLTVKQRTDIADMMNRKNNENNKDGESEGYKKFKEISQNKKLFELAKKQTEEIELLREELNRLKAKTFANFTNQTSKF